MRDALLPEFDHEMSTTRRLLERVPEDRLSWQPHPKSMTLGRLATHIAEIPKWATTIMKDSVFEMDPGSYVPKTVTSRTELLKTFDDDVASARDAVGNPTAIVARMTRSSMLDVLRQDYIKTAKAKGLSQLSVIFKHALRNALIPVVTTIGLQFGVLLGGAILTETIFAWPGVGKWMYDAVMQRDYMVIQGGVLFIAALFVFINLCVDVLYAIINPRISVN